MRTAKKADATASAAQKKEKKKKSADGSMPLTGHLRELRNRVLVCVGVLLLVSLVALAFADDVVDTLLQIGLRYGYAYVYLAPQELMLEYVKVSLLIGLCVSVPVILYELWAFMRPGLKKSENSFFLLGIVLGLACFAGGVAFAYYITLPAMLFFFTTLSTDIISSSISVSNYLDFLLLVFIIFGVVFEMPMLSVILSQLGLITPKLLRKARSWAIVLIFLIAAFITPTDIFSQFLVAIPMCALYELSIVLSAVITRRRKKKGGDEADEDEDEGEDNEEDKDGADE